MTKNQNVLKWVEEMKALTQPDKVVWIDGSEEQLKALRDEAIATGEMIELYHYLHYDSTLHSFKRCRSEIKRWF